MMGREKRREWNRKNGRIRRFRTGLLMLAAGLLLCGCGSEKYSQGSGENGVYRGIKV